MSICGEKLRASFVCLVILLFLGKESVAVSLKKTQKP